MCRRTSLSLWGATWIDLPGCGIDVGGDTCWAAVLGRIRPGDQLVWFRCCVGVMNATIPIDRDAATEPNTVRPALKKLRAGTAS